jgi:hypothetical protein
MNLFLLQSQPQYFKEDDPVAGIILVVGVGVVLLVFLIKSIVQNGLGINKGTGKAVKTGSSARHFSIFSMYRIAKTYGLNREQAKTLEYVLRSNGVVDPESTVANPGALDKHFKRAFRQTENSAGTEEEAQQKLSMLFSARNAIDIRHNTSAGSPAAQQISSGMPAVLSVNQDSHSVKVISSKKDTVLVDCPRNSIGTLIKFPKGTRVNLAFFAKNSKGFSIDTQVVGTADTSFGPALQLFRAGQVKAMTQRRFRRRQIVLDCNFYNVRLENSKNRKPPKLIVEPRSMAGTVMDISIGGCAIKASISLPPGSRLKIEFNYDRSVHPVAVLGQVLRINRSGIAITIMHIKFLKVPRKAMNAINALVFEYGD